MECFGVDPSSFRHQKEFHPGANLLVDFFSRDAVRKAFGEQQFKIITSIAMLILFHYLSRR